MVKIIYSWHSATWPPLLDLILFLWRMSTVLEMKRPSTIVQLLPLVKFLKIQSVYNPTIYTAGTTCTTTGCIEGFVRLVDGPAFYDGRIEVCRNKQWLSVCDIGVDTSYICMLYL